MAGDTRKTKKHGPKPATAKWVRADQPAPAAPAEGQPNLDEEYRALIARLPVDAPGAVDEYRFFRERVTQHGDRHLIALCSIDLGAAYDAAGDRRNARIEFQRVVAHAASAGDHNLVGIAKDWLGMVAQTEQRFDDALKLHTEALASLRKAGKPKPLSRCLNNLGLLKARAQDGEGAAACFREARDLREKAGDREAVARMEANLGVVALLTGRMPDASAHFRAAMAIVQAFAHDAEGAAQDLRATVMANLGVCEEAEGRLVESMAASGEAASIFAERENRKGLADARHNIGVAALRAGDDKRALQEFNLASTSATAAGERAAAAESIFNIAVCNARCGAADLAKRAAQAARAEFTHFGDQDGLARTAEFLELLPKASEFDAQARMAELAFSTRARLSLQAARLTT